MSDPQADIRSLIGRIVKSFSAADLGAFRQCYTLPCLVTMANGTSVLGNDAEFEQFFSQAPRSLHERGFTRTAVERQQIRVFNVVSALTSIAWVRYAGDDVLEKLGATYTLAHSDGGWKIVALIAHSDDQVIALG